MSVGQNDMRLAHHLLRHPSGVWHFRLIVPADLQAMLGRRVLKKSLGTRDPVVARAWAYALGAQYAQAFAVARGRGSRMGSDFEDYLKGLKGFEIEQGPEPHQFKMRTNGTPEDNQAAKEALAQLLKLTSVRRTSSAWDEPTPAASPAPGPAAGPVVPNRPRAIGLVADAWLKSIQADTLRKTMTIKSAAVMGFARHVGLKKMLHEVQREDVHAWVEALRASGLQTPTLVNKTSYLRGFFTWAVQAGHYPKFPKDENPAMGHVIFRAREKIKRKAMGFKAFNADQVRTLYAPKALDQLSDGARWGAVIGLYTGARVSEVGQLDLANFAEVDGVPCLTITDEGEGQSLKNGASRRTIPIHPDLLALGLMERVKRLRSEGQTRLFPKVKIGAVNGAGNWLSKAFTRHIAAVGIEQPAKGKYGFHSLRKTAIQTMKDGRVPLEWRCAYVGHELDEEHVETYSGDYAPGTMLDIVAPGLGWAIDLADVRQSLWRDA